MGQTPSDEEIFEMLASVDEDGSGSIDFGEFIQVIRDQQAAQHASNDDSDSTITSVTLVLRVFWCVY